MRNFPTPAPAAADRLAHRHTFPSSPRQVNASYRWSENTNVQKPGECGSALRFNTEMFCVFMQLLIRRLRSCT